MSMLLTCSNSGCGYSDYHRLDTESNEVICTKCLKPVSVSSYAKTALKSMKQVVSKVRSEFEVTCDNCGAVDGPALKKFGKHITKVVCNQCGLVNDHLSKYFVEALKLKPGIVVTNATPEEMAKAGINSQPTRFNRADTAQLNVTTTETVLATPPEDKQPPKVEYYTGKEDSPLNPQGTSGAVVVSPATGEPVNVDRKAQAAPKRVNIKKPATVTPREAAVRQRIENMPASVSVHPEPKAPGLNLSDLARTGVTDYAGDVED